MEPLIRYDFGFANVGRGGGPMVRYMEETGDPGYLRPWRGRDGNTYVTVNSGQVDKDGNPIDATLQVHTNAPALLRREDWLMIDRAVEFAAKQRLRLWGDVYGANPFNIPNGFGTTAIQHAVASGDADAVISMDPIRRSERTRPILDTVTIPLPCIHSDGNFSSRVVATSRNSGMPLDTTPIELAVRRVSEEVEKLTVGTSTYAYGGNSIYGLTNFPQRITTVLTAPNGTNGAAVIANIVGMLKALQDKFYYGPYMIYYSNNWNNYLDLDYNTTYPTGETLRQRIMRIDGVAGMRNIDYLPTANYHLIAVQMTSDVIQGVQGMAMTTVQWEEQGGFELCFKVLCIMIPRLKYDYNSNTGINHGSI
jgi:hypothetical protein